MVEQETDGVMAQDADDRMEEEECTTQYREEEYDSKRMNCPSPISIKDPRTNRTSMITVACGKCGACRYNRRVDWSFRLKEELKVAKSAWFITLTYSDDKLPVIKETGEVTLRKKDVQNFLKKIRKLNKWKLRYYMVGEYGTETDRPHYHIILFNLQKENINKIKEKWEFGHIHIGEVSEASIHYVTKYHVNRRMEKGTRQPEYATMSRNPGIGNNYIERNLKWHRENEYFHIINNGYLQRMPRYYKERIFTEMERQIQANKIQEKVDEEYNNEIDRLKSLGIEEPHINIRKSEYIASKNVKHKSNRSSTF